jgi:hypothetical protein
LEINLILASMSELRQPFGLRISFWRRSKTDPGVRCFSERLAELPV